eukprot:TRINITY_DN11412_c0_g1_i1.p1 TRINITY_DN11412_c0_g1~~TRINITY_DN11412_c0_g1_i1.p1  ORF type:complete len:141 (+),score=25.28 TRINITY_DN11412_c0_g1_i1:58-480(+)
MMMNGPVINGLGLCPHEEMLRQQMAMMQPAPGARNTWWGSPRGHMGDDDEVMMQELMYEQQLARLGGFDKHTQKRVKTGGYRRECVSPVYDPTLAYQDNLLVYEIPAGISEAEWVKQQLAAEGYCDSDDGNSSAATAPTS